MMAATIVGCTAVAASAQPAELELAPLLPLWEHSVAARVGGGFKDNVSLSHAAPEASAFLSAAVDAMVSRFFLDGSQLSFFLSGDDRRYLSPAPVDLEQLAFGRAQFKKVLTGDSEASFTAEYLYQDQVLDVSVTETNRTAVRVRGHSLTARPGFRGELGAHFWCALELPVTRRWLDLPLDDSWECGPKFTLGHAYGFKSELSLSYEPTRREFDTYRQLAADGTPLSGTRRAFTQQDVRAVWRHHWDENRCWRTTARLGCKLNEDGGSGYFDFTQFYGYGEVRYRAPNWEVAADTRLSFWHYPVQTVSRTAPARRERSEWLASLRCERRLWKQLRLVAEYSYEEVFSNDALETYTANSVSGALEWEF